MKPVLVQCDTCGKAVAPRYARERVTLWARTVGSGGTLSNTEQVTRENIWRCDHCLIEGKYGTSLFGEAK